MIPTFHNPMRVASAVVEANLQMMMLVFEAHSVIVYRSLGMAGLWPVNRRERMRMLSEKPPAFAASALAGTRAMISGKRPDEVVAAAIRPLRHKTRSNARRLSRGR